MILELLGVQAYQDAQRLTGENARLRSLLIEARDALRAIEARHVEANARHGRPEAESGTLALARGVLARIQAEVGHE